METHVTKKLSEMTPQEMGAFLKQRKNEQQDDISKAAQLRDALRDPDFRCSEAGADAKEELNRLEGSRRFELFIDEIKSVKTPDQFNRAFKRALDEPGLRIPCTFCLRAKRQEEALTKLDPNSPEAEALRKEITDLGVDASNNHRHKDGALVACKDRDPNRKTLAREVAEPLATDVLTKFIIIHNKKMAYFEDARTYAPQKSIDPRVHRAWHELQIAKQRVWPSGQEKHRPASAASVRKTEVVPSAAVVSAAAPAPKAEEKKQDSKVARPSRKEWGIYTCRFFDIKGGLDALAKLNLKSDQLVSKLDVAFNLTGNVKAALEAVLPATREELVAQYSRKPRQREERQTGRSEQASSPLQDEFFGLLKQKFPEAKVPRWLTAKMADGSKSKENVLADIANTDAFGKLVRTYSDKDHQHGNNRSNGKSLQPVPEPLVDDAPPQEQTVTPTVDVAPAGKASVGAILAAKLDKPVSEVVEDIIQPPTAEKESLRQASKKEKQEKAFRAGMKLRDWLEPLRFDTAVERGLLDRIGKNVGKKKPASLNALLAKVPMELDILECIGTKLGIPETEPQPVAAEAVSSEISVIAEKPTAEETPEVVAEESAAAQA